MKLWVQNMNEITDIFKMQLNGSMMMILKNFSNLADSTILW